MSSTEISVINSSVLVTMAEEDNTPVQMNSYLHRVIMQSIMIFLVVSSNFLILLAFAIEKQLRVYTNYYIVNMAIADSLVGLVVMGFSLWQMLMDYRWPFGHVSCSIIMSITHTLLHVSVVMIVIISIDRWYAVYYPLKHLQQRSKKNAIRRNILVWLLCFVFWGSFIGVWRQADEARYEMYTCGPVYQRYIAGTLVAASVYYWIPATIIGVVNFSIYRKIRSSGSNTVSENFKADNKSSLGVKSYSSSSGSQTSIPCVSSSDTYEVPSDRRVTLRDNPVKESEDGKSSRTHVSDEDKENKHKKAEKENVPQRDVKASRQKKVRQQGNSLDGTKAQRTLSLLIIALIITWTPYMAVILTTTYCFAVLQATRICFPGLVLNGSIWVSWSNSLLNPLMYAVAQPSFRLTIMRILLRKPR